MEVDYVKKIPNDGDNDITENQRYKDIKIKKVLFIFKQYL